MGEIRMKLHALVGYRYLSGVDLLDERGWPVPDEENWLTEEVRFILDGHVYVAEAEPGLPMDRSMMGKFYRADPDSQKSVVQNTFPQVPVIVEYRGHPDDVLTLMDTTGKKSILDVGTDSSKTLHTFLAILYDPLVGKKIGAVNCGRHIRFVRKECGMSLGAIMDDLNKWEKEHARLLDALSKYSPADLQKAVDILEGNKQVIEEIFEMGDPDFTPDPVIDDDPDDGVIDYDHDDIPF